MTYNFDADRWLARQLEALAERCRRGELDEPASRREREMLELAYERMIDRLDGTFELPAARSPARGTTDDDPPTGPG